MPIVDAVSAPRFSATSNLIDVTNRIPEYELAPLREQGYHIVRSPSTFEIGRVHGITQRAGLLQGGADPGSDGVALGINHRLGNR